MLTACSPHLTVLPTHRCFDDVADWFRSTGCHLTKKSLEMYEICHGVCFGSTVGTDPGPPHRYAHAWLLHSDGFVLDFGKHSVTGETLMMKVEKAAFYDSRAVQMEVVYTIYEAAKASHLAGGCGPWRHCIRQFTSDADGKTFSPEVNRLGRQYIYDSGRNRPSSSQIL